MYVALSVTVFRPHIAKTPEETACLMREGEFHPTTGRRRSNASFREMYNSPAECDPRSLAHLSKASSIHFLLLKGRFLLLRRRLLPVMTSAQPWRSHRANTLAGAECLCILLGNKVRSICFIGQICVSFLHSYQPPLDGSLRNLR